MKTQIPNSRFKDGFTLVEMIVAIAIFMIVAVVAVGSLVRIVGLNREAQTLQASVDNVGFALDSMSREIRQGANIACLASYTGGPIDPSGISTESANCSNMQAEDNQLIVFETVKSAPDGSGGTCNLYYGYWFAPPDPGVSGQYELKKAQQTSCHQQFNGDQSTGNFYPVVDTSTVSLDNYNLAVFAGSPSFTYKWVFIRLSGVAGVRTQDQNSFDVETSVSQRVSD